MLKFIVRMFSLLPFGFAKTTGPLFSLSASGTVAKTLTYAIWKGTQYVRQHFIPANPQTATQTNVRYAWELLVAFWKDTVGAPDKILWDTLAEGSGMSGFNKMMEYGMKSYVTQITPAVTPASCGYTGVPADNTWTWT